MGLPVHVSTPYELYRGDARSLRFEFYSDTAQAVPLDLTTYGTVFTAQARISPDSALLAALTVSAASAAAGVLTVTIAPTDWTAFAGVRAAAFDIQAANVGGTDVTTLVRGLLVFESDVTHG